jgi:sec-independent protein translocase protein TatA
MLGLDNPVHLAFLLILLLLVFGAKRLPEMGRSLGAGLRGFKESISDEHSVTPMSAEQSLPRATELPSAATVTPEPIPAPVADRTPVRPAA